MSCPVKYKSGHVVSKLLGFPQSVLGQKAGQERQAKLCLLKDSTVTAYPEQTGMMSTSEHNHET